MHVQAVERPSEPRGNARTPLRARQLTRFGWEACGFRARYFRTGGLHACSAGRMLEKSDESENKSGLEIQMTDAPLPSSMPRVCIEMPAGPAALLNREVRALSALPSAVHLRCFYRLRLHTGVSSQRGGFTHDSARRTGSQAHGVRANHRPTCGHRVR